MEDDIKLLTAITETADMGRNSLKYIMEKTDNNNLKSALQKQYEQYDKTYREAERLLCDINESPKKIGAPIKLYTQMVSGIKTLTAENKTSKIAEMVIQGSTMGVTEMTQHLHSCSEASNNVIALAQQHVQTESANIEKMKKFL